MTTRIRQPLYVYDEPVEYKEFYGGINTDPSIANVADYELLDGVNLTYKNKSLARRLGASAYKNLIFNEIEPDKTRGKVQLQCTLNTDNDTYYVVVRDGLIYYSSINLEEDLLSMIELPIKLNDTYFDGTLKKYSPLNITLGLTVYEEGDHPDPLLNQDGYIKHIHTDKDIDYRFTTLDDDSAMGTYIPASYHLILQNFRPMHSIVYKDSLYIATGTRFIRISEYTDNDVVFLQAEIVEPKQLNGWEYANIGFNYLSPFPTNHVFDTSLVAEPQIHNILCSTHHVFIGDTSIDFDTIIDFENGKDKNSYEFKWEFSILKEGESSATDWEEYQGWTKGLDVLNINPQTAFTFSDASTYTLQAGDTLFLRVTFSDKFVDETDSEGIVTGKTPDPIYAKFGSTYTSYTVKAGIADDFDFLPSQKFLEIHSCNRILSDGNKIILYGTPYNSANWYKCVIDNFDYFTDAGQLDFQTNKNERLIAAIHLDGNIIVFANNPYLGGSIHLVTGNGDDYSGDDYYSPYKRKLIHSSISCDHPNSVQYVENYILFKYKQTVWKLHSRDLESEKIKLVAVNSNIIHNNSELSFPTVEYSADYESELYSFVTEEYYGIVFPKEQVQWKMYYKQSISTQSQDLSYPWLRDISEYLDVDGIITINGETHYLTQDNILYSFSGEDYKDLGDDFKHRIVLKPFDLTYPGVTKFLNSILLNFNRGNTDVLKLNVYAYNESKYKIFGEKKTAFVDKYTKEIVYATASNYYDEDADLWDQPSLTLGVTNLGGTKLGTPYFYSKMFTVERRFPFLNVIIIIESSSAEAFTLSSITFNYATSDISAVTLPKLYSEIIREED